MLFSLALLPPLPVAWSQDIEEGSRQTAEELSCDLSGTPLADVEGAYLYLPSILLDVRMVDSSSSNRYLPRTPYPDAHSVFGPDDEPRLGFVLRPILREGATGAAFQVRFTGPSGTFQLPSKETAPGPQGVQSWVYPVRQTVSGGDALTPGLYIAEVLYEGAVAGCVSWRTESEAGMRPHASEDTAGGVEASFGLGWSEPELWMPVGRTESAFSLYAAGRNLVAAWLSYQSVTVERDGRVISGRSAARKLYYAGFVNSRWVGPTEIAGCGGIPTVFGHPAGKVYVADQLNVGGCLYGQQDSGGLVRDAIFGRGMPGPGHIQAAVVDSEGTVYAAWLEREPGVTYLCGADCGILLYGRRLKEGGWSPPQRLSQSTAYTPRLVLGPDDSVHAAWVERESGAPPPADGWAVVYAYQPRGGLWSEPERLDDGNRDSGLRATLLVSEGVVCVIKGLFTQRLACSLLDRTEWTPWEPLPGGLFPAVSQLAAAMAADGTIYLLTTRVEDQAGHLPASPMQFATRYPDGTWDVPQSLGDPKVPHQSAAIAVDDIGTIHVVYTAGLLNEMAVYDTRRLP